MTAIQKPDPTDPRTSPLVQWRGSVGIRVIWRKSDDLFYYHYGHNGLSTVNLDLLKKFTDDANLYDLQRTKSSEIAPHILQELYGRRSNRLIDARAVGTPQTTWFIRRVNQFASLRSVVASARVTIADMAPCMKNLADAYRDGDSPRYELDDIVEHANGLGDVYRKLLVNATNRIAYEAGKGNVIKLCDCGHVEHHDDAVTAANGRDYCADCAEDLVTVDGDYYEHDSVYYWESDGEYHLYEEEDEEEDEDDENDGSSEHIASWSTPANDHHLDHDVSFTSTALDDFTMGVELEVECDSRHSFADAVDEANDHMNKRMRYAMFKRDGSLSPQGFEIVTAARRLDEHVERFSSWKPHSSLSAWNPGTCGVHVHIDSRAFSGLSLGKFLMFINDVKNKGFIKALAGRHPAEGGTAASYCAAMNQEHLSTPAKALKGGDPSRYRMVNLCNLSHNEAERLGADATRDCKGNYSTVELRIFRASLKKERLLAQIEFSHAAVMFCRVTPWHALNGDAFKAWLAPVAGRYKHLARWYGINLPKVNKVSPAPKVWPIDETV